MHTKEIATSFFNAVLSGDADTMRQLANSDYIQHNPFIPTGLEPLIKMLPVLQEHGTSGQIIRAFQDGQYVFMHNIWNNAQPFGAEQMVSFDILRIDDEGKIAEHWDALTPVVADTVNGRTQTDGPTDSQDQEKTQANKDLVLAFAQDVLMGKEPANITKYIHEDCHQHHPGIKDGLDGIQEAMQQLASQGNLFQYTKIHNVMGEGDFVLVTSEGQWHDKPQAFYDLFRVSDGMIVEHWDVIQEIPTEGLAHDNGMFSFPQA